MTNKEKQQLLTNVKFPQGLNFGEMINILWWSMFNLKKMNIFYKKLQQGMSLRFAYKDTKN